VIEEAGVSATVLTARDFAARQNPIDRRLFARRAGVKQLRKPAQRWNHQLFARGGDSSSTLVFVGRDASYPEPGGAIDLTNLTTAGIDRVEVIRGPESALFEQKHPVP